MKLFVFSLDILYIMKPKYKHVQIIMACHILYGRPYCNDAPEGVGGITPPKLNRGG